VPVLSHRRSLLRIRFPVGSKGSSESFAETTSDTSTRATGDDGGSSKTRSHCSAADLLPDWTQFRRWLPSAGTHTRLLLQPDSSAPILETGARGGPVAAFAAAAADDESCTGLAAAGAAIGAM